MYKDAYRIGSARRHRWDYRDPAAYFVTICTKDRAPLLGSVAIGKMHESRCGELADLHLCQLAEHYDNVIVDRFVVMPNHVHAILVIDGKHRFSPDAELQIEPRHCYRDGISPKPGSVAAIIRSYKSGVARECHLAGFTTFAWLSRYYDHIIRSDISLNAIRKYIDENPINWPDDPDLLQRPCP